MPEVFSKTQGLAHLKEILLLEGGDSSDKLHSVDHLTLGDLEDLVGSAARQLRASCRTAEPDLARQKEDARLLKEHRLRPSRVNVERAQNSSRLSDAYGEARRALEDWRTDPEAVYFWDKERKCQLLAEQLRVVKDSWLRPGKRAVYSSDSEEDIRWV